MAASARRKNSKIAPVSARTAPVRLANGDDATGATPVQDQHLMLEAVFSAPQEQPYPIAVKAALFIGVPTALWAVIILGGAQLLRLASS